MNRFLPLILTTLLAACSASGPQGSASLDPATQTGQASSAPAAPGVLSTSSGQVLNVPDIALARAPQTGVFATVDFSAAAHVQR